MNVKSEKKRISKHRKNAVEESGEFPNLDSIKELAVLIHDRIGLHFSENKKRVMLQGIARAGKALDYSSTDSFVDFLLKNEWNQEIIDSIVSELTIGETYFLRNRKMFDMIENCVIPEKSKDKKLKFWSAACSTGEEPYSIAAVLDRRIPQISSWDIEILASDINRDALQKAEKGVYRPWSFRESQFPDKEYYFSELDSGSFKIHRKIKKMVKFFRLNLISKEYPSVLNRTTDCDIIFCRNVLIYFSLGTAEKVIRRLYRCLKPGGFLILSATELALVPENLFELIELCGNLVLRKPLNPRTASNLLTFNFKHRDNCEIRRKIKVDKNDSEYKELKLSAVDVKQEKKELNREVSTSNTEHRTSNEWKYNKLLYSQVNDSVAGKQEKSDSLKKTRCVFSSDEKYKEAELLADRGKYKEALRMCQQAIDEEPLQARWNYLYSVVLFESDKVVDAAKAISKVLYLDADNIMGHIMSGHINNALGKEKMAKKSFDNAVMILKKLNRDDVVHGSGGVSAERLQTTIEAVYGGI